MSRLRWRRHVPTGLIPFTTPTPPATFSTTRPTFGGTKRVVSSGATLQAAIDASVDGDWVALTQGANIDGQFVLRNRGTAGVVEISTDISTAAFDAVCPPDTRFTPAMAATLNLATLRSTLSNGLLVSDFSAAGWRLTGVAATLHPSLASSTGLIRFGNSGLWLDSQASSDMLVDRCWIYGAGKAKNIRRGVQLCGPRQGVINSTVEQFYDQFSDSQAVAAYAYQGPYLIENCYLDAWGETAMIGGSQWGFVGTGTASCIAGVAIFTSSQAAAMLNGTALNISSGNFTTPGTSFRYVVSAFDGSAICTLTPTNGGPSTFSALPFRYGDPDNALAVPSDVTVRRNYMTRRSADWDAVAFGKNGFELKTCRRALIEYNIIENVAELEQFGYGFSCKSVADGGFTQDGVSDIEFRGNQLRYVSGGISITANPGPSDQLHTKRVYAHDNLIEHINDTAPWDQGGGSPTGTVLTFSGDLDRVTVEHNTSVKAVNTGKAGVQVDNGAVVTVAGVLTVRDNILQYGFYGIKADSTPAGNASWVGYTGSLGIWNKNVLVGDANTSEEPGGPTKTLACASDAAVGYVDLAGGGTGYALSGSSPFKGQATDGVSDPGIRDVVAFFANLAGVE